ncbi:MAG: ATP-binding cassette domain-containing protein [Duncaniella sp.]|nr:ATP-binding cassette domain-containing protein [Duncaniella sp.]
METITLDRVLPIVFHGSENEASVKDSLIWLREVTFSRGTDYLIEATSGAGKSSLCSFIYGVRIDYEGVIRIGDCDARSLSPRDWSKLRCSALAYLPQQLSLFPELTVMENIDIKNRLTGFKTRSEICDMLEQLGIDDKKDQPAALLSVGQQQRVAMVRTLCQPFSFMLLDEPVSHLDEANNRTAAEMIVTEARRQGGSIISTSVGNTIEIDSFTRLRL